MGVLKRGFLVGLQTTWTLGKVIFPITLIVTILGFTPVLDWLARMLAPVMSWIGLPGEAAIPLVLGNVMNLYASIGAIVTMDLSVKEVFILAVMLSFSHNLFIESAVTTKVGIRMSVVLFVRVGLAIVSALLIHWLWNGGQEPAQYGLIPASQPQVEGWLPIIWQGISSASLGILQLAMIVIPLMIFVQVMKERNWLQVVSRLMAPFTRMLGIKENTSTTLASGLLFGMAYGAGVMIQAAKEDGVSKKDLYLVFIFLVACHAVIEDTLIFIPLGIPVWPLLLVRLVTAIVLTIVVAFVWNRLEKKQALEGKEATYEH
ncbi:nucleoside recognition domain-containing protein [Halalkalibacter suaedae]|uniref:Nucleoside transporter/FeoB GTPase Gate domain-containing protein n=1 Tax=Halalkalibacter suaedae TaxID=2822140 RepID=A0A941AM18_9BACI|nr:nucleoside recognition domain-containing protein [Bacillus suaedae]MBP3949990.1 hypothetical protein [Bacillus suaedae]